MTLFSRAKVTGVRVFSIKSNRSRFLVAHAPVLHYRIALRQKSLSRIFAGKLSAGGDFLWGDFIMEKLFMAPVIF